MLFAVMWSLLSDKQDDIGIQSLDTAVYEQLLAVNGFSVRAYLAEDPECGKHTVWLATLDAG